jgi:hypothetical protein
MSAKHNVSFRSKAAALRATAESYTNPELRTGILELAEQWEELASRIEAEAMKTSRPEAPRR